MNSKDPSPLERTDRVPLQWAASDLGYATTLMDRVLIWLRLTIAQRKWIIWVALLVLVLVLAQIVLELVPHHALNTFLQLEEKSNGVQEGHRTG
jgi:hypothetical protein